MESYRAGGRCSQSLGATLVGHRYPRPLRLRSPKAQAMRLSWLTPLRRRHVPKRANPWEIVAASVSGLAAQARPRCAFVRGKRTAEPTLSLERWFLSGCYPKAMKPARPRLIHSNVEVAVALLVDRNEYDII